MSVTVPTVECDPPPRRFWSTITARLRFSIASASGGGYFGRKPRMKRLKFSYSCRCASVAIVSKTMDDFPEPETPVKMVICRFGMRSVTSFRLFSRAPRISMDAVMGGRSFYAYHPGHLHFPSGRHPGQSWPDPDRLSRLD